MFKPRLLAQAVAFALVLPAAAMAELEISGYAKIEYSLFTADGQVTGSDEAHEAGDAMKTEPSIKLFMNSDVGEESSFHAEILLADDGEAASDRLEGGEAYSQYEVLREFYFDTSGGGWDWRLGKQQVVWGTADGIKLLDIINPTDYRELNQNTSEDARIPVWMINAEKQFDNGGNLQVIVSEARPNFIAGLDEDGDSGAPFIFKGVDTITGATGGFLNIANDFGRTSGVFETLLQFGGVGGLQGPFNGLTVGGFTGIGTGGMNPTFDQAVGGLLGSGAITPSSDEEALLKVVFNPLVNQFGTGNNVLNAAANDAGSVLIPAFGGYLGSLGAGFYSAYSPDGSTQLINDGDAFTNTASVVLDVIDGGGNPGQDGLADVSLVGQTINAAGSLIYQQVAGGLGFDPFDPASLPLVAAALGVATPANPLNPFAADTITFNTAVQNAGFSGLAGSYFQDGTTNQFNGTLEIDAPTDAFSHLDQTLFGTFTNFIGMSTEYRQDHPDGEGNFGIRWKNSTDGGTSYSLNYLYAYDPNPVVALSWEDQGGNKLNVTTSTVAPTTLTPGGTLVTLTNPDNTPFNPQTQGGAVLVFEETLERVNNLGGSFDMALEGTSIPTVIRGEFLYQVDARAPVIDRNKLAYGDLAGALVLEKTDFFKYVIGVDLTVATNMLVSTQLIQMYNLDYVDSDKALDGSDCPTTTDNCGVYTGDFSSMSVSNGLNKGDEVETFVSLFLSKPFGPDVQHRWNNITIAENGGGYWNRFDVEYSFNDEMLGTVEFNKYWGDEDTTFGQFEDSSNLQLGFKYIF
jgi:hypothetical protein